MEKKFITDFKLSLKKEFYNRDTITVARELLGNILVRKISDNDYLAGKIIETEAYLSENDFASHSAHGLTTRNGAMFEEGGILYIYLIYGIHYCMNIVTESKGIGAAILIRAIEPLAGIEIMKQNRDCTNEINLCNGPAKLTKAFGLDINNNYQSLLKQELFIQKNINFSNEEIIETKRIGITKSADLPLRFYISNNNYVSRKK